jgi:hypothetical protein
MADWISAPNRWFSASPLQPTEIRTLLMTLTAAPGRQVVCSDYTQGKVFIAPPLLSNACRLRAAAAVLHS